MKAYVRHGAGSSDHGPAGLVAAFSRDLLDALDLDITAYDEEFVRQALTRNARASKFRSTDTYGTYLVGNRAAAEAFCQALRVSYSDFFRNPLAFALLEQQVLPALFAKKKLTGCDEIRIWSVGCSTGQETWSVAMLVDDLTRAANPPQTCRIFASDLSEQVLAVARAGTYSSAAVANVRHRHLDECFSRQGEFHVIVPRLRALVDFSVYDLLDPSTSSPMASIYGDFDLILCCNLLYYYRPSIQHQILNKICRALAPGGYCVTGETEQSIVARGHGLRAVIPTSSVFLMDTQPRINNLPPDPLTHNI